MSTPAPSAKFRVTKLTYKVEQLGQGRIAEGVGVRSEVTLDGFTGVIEPRSAVFTPSREFTSVDEARAVLEPQLNAWRAWVQLTKGEDLMAFAFASAARETSPPVPDGHYVLVLDSAALSLTGHIPIALLTYGQIPEPPPAFRCDDLVEVGVALYADARNLSRHTGKFGYAFLTMIKDRYGNEILAAKALHVDRPVLAEFKDMCTRGGSGVEMRKATKGSRLEFTAARAEWLMRVFRELILRHGQVAAGAAPQDQFVDLCPGADEDFPHRAKMAAHGRPG